MVYHKFINMKKEFVFSLLFLFSLNLLSQETRNILWNGTNKIVEEDSVIALLDFENSSYNPEISHNNIYVEKIPINNRNVEFEIFDIKYMQLSDSELNKVSA